MSSFRICTNCYGYRVYPWMGFMTGERYQCQDCENISAIILEFDDEESYKAVLAARLSEEE